MGAIVLWAGMTPCILAAAISPSAFQQVCDELRAVTLVQADFVEQKTLHILSHPLESKGTLLFSPRRGVYRVMKEPVRQEILITREHLVQRDALGHVNRMSVRGQPAAQAFVDVFLSFFAGDPRGWDKTFEAMFSGSVDAWTINLIPRRKSPAAKALRQIVLAGHGGVLDTMTITEANGDETQTSYSNQKVFHDENAAASSSFPTDLKFK